MQLSRYLTHTALSAILLSASSGVMAQVTTPKYNIDLSHSKVGFEISHLMISTVEGSFKTFSGTFRYDAATHSLSDSTIAIQAASIDTNEAKRDQHLQGPDFLDANQFPILTFTPSKLEKKDAKPSFLHGMLQMRGVTKPVTLHVEFGGIIKDPMMGVNRMAFTLTGEINRKDFGMVWNKVLDAGGLAIGEMVKIKIRIEAVEEVPKKETETRK